jgi:ankyrin repeat protein
MKNIKSITFILLLCTASCSWSMNYSACSRFEPRQTPKIVVAAACDDLESVKFWVEQKNANVNDYSSLHETPLHFAVYRGNVAMIRYLLSKGAYSDVQDYEGYKPADYAATNEIKRLLISKN